MRFGLPAGAILLLVLAGCSAAPTEPETPPNIVYIDEFPTWSPLGDSIAYHRRVASGDGPPGVYVVHVSGSGTRLVVADDGSPISDLQFSPDGTMLAGSRDGQLVVISRANGTIVELFHTDNLAVWPDWSPDQSKIVLSRVAWDSSESPDSAGVHVYDFATNQCRPLFHSSPSPTFGLYPKWSPDGTTIAFVLDDSLCLAQADGTGSRPILVAAAAGEELSTPRWIEGGQRILYEHFLDGSYTTWVTSTDGTVFGRWPVRFGDSEAISPDGQDIVVRSGRREGNDVYVLLFRRSVFGPASEALVPVSTYVP